VKVQQVINELPDYKIFTAPRCEQKNNE